MRFWKKKKVAKIEAVEKPKQEAKFSSDPYFLEGIGKELQAAREQVIKARSYQRVAPFPEGSAMDSAIYPLTPSFNFSNVNMVALSYFAAANSFIGYSAMEIIGQDWLVIKGNTMAVKNAVKKWYKITSNDGSILAPDQIKAIEKADRAYRLKQNMVQAIHMRNQFGIRHILFKHTNPHFDYSKPFNPDSWGVGEYAGISQIDPRWITPEIQSDDLTDPTRIGFYEPEFWVINGQRYHKSHFVILYGEEVSDLLKPTYRYGGISKNQLVYERMYAAHRSANEAPQLLATKRQFYQKMKLPEAQAKKSDIQAKIESMTATMNNYGRNVIGVDDELGKFETTLSDLTDVINNQYQIVAAVYNEPISAFMSGEMKGFSSGETEENFSLSNVEELQGNDLRHLADGHYARLAPTFMNPVLKIDSEIDITWNPVKVMTAAEKAQVNNLNAQTDNILDTIGAITARDSAKRIASDPDSGYNGMEIPDPRETDYEADFEDDLGVDNG